MLTKIAKGGGNHFRFRRLPKVVEDEALIGAVGLASAGVRTRPVDVLAAAAPDSA